MSDDFTFEIDLTPLSRQLAAVARKYGSGDAEVALAFGGPAAPYAVKVHEDVNVHHPTGEAEFLKRELLANASTLARTIGAMISAGMSPSAALHVYAELRMTGAKGRTPVKTGALRNSGHVRDGGIQFGG